MTTIDQNSDAIGDQENMPARPLLPLDAIFEILIRTDIEHMPILKQVCKDWYNLLSEPIFLTNHHQRAKAVYRGYIFRPLFKKNQSGDVFFVSHLHSPTPKAALNISFLPEAVKIEASTSHGILYCVGYDQPINHYVCKPTTKEWTVIPKPTISRESIKIAMVVTFKDDGVLWFKVLRIPSYWDASLPEVFDSETGKWVHIENLGVNDSVVWGTMVNGCYCWFEPTSNYNQINAFDVWREELSTLDVPRELGSNNSKSLASLNENQLCLIYPLPRGLKTELWVMNSMVDRRWEKRWAFDFFEDFNLGETNGFANVVVDGILLVQDRYHSW